MIFFRQKINFDDFLYQAFQNIFTVYENNKESILDQAQWENKYKMIAQEREKLWELFIYFIPTGLLFYSIIYFKGRYSTQELASEVVKIFFIFLNKEKHYTLEELEEFEKKFMPFIKDVEEKGISLEEKGYNDILANVSITFSDIFCPTKIENKYPLDPFKSKESQMHFAAFKLAKAYLAKGGLIEKIFGEFKIIYNQK